MTYTHTLRLILRGKWNGNTRSRRKRNDIKFWHVR